MLPHSLARTDAIITVSTQSQQDIERFLYVPTAQVVVIAEAAEAHFTHIGDTPERSAILARYGITSPYILYVGAINGRKNIARLLDAYAMLAPRHPHVNLVIGGKRQWQTGEIDTTLQRLNLGQRLHFTGYVDDTDLPALYSAAELFVFPSLYEGFGLPPLEAMACGAAVVTSNTSSLPEVVGDAAVLIDPYDVSALADAMDRLLSDAALRADMQQRGLAQAARFTWKRTAQDTRAVYDRLLHQKKKSA